MEVLQVFGVFGLFVIFSAAQNSSRTSPTYLISAPNVFRHGVPTTLSVTIFTISPVTVVSKIMHDNISVSKIKSMVPGGSTQLQVLPPVPETNKSYWLPYELVITGYVGSTVLFTNSTLLQYTSKSLSTFIQTDKSNYKPGQTVKVRVISIHPDGTPFESPVDMVIKDPKGNRIRQWLDLDCVLGVVSKEFQLSKNPSLGAWTIMTVVKDVMKEKQFNVDNYVLPRFEIKIDVPEFLLYKETLRGSVHAQYTFGKPVQGMMNITYYHMFNGLKDRYNEEREIDGSADFRFDIPNHIAPSKRSLDFKYQFGYLGKESVDITVSVTELYTGLKYSSNATVTLVRSKYCLSFQEYPRIIRPSLNFSAQVKISTYDMTPLSVKDQGKMLRLTVIQQKLSPWTWKKDDLLMVPRGDNGSEMVTFSPSYVMELPVPADGVVSFNVQLSDHIATLNVEAEFEDTHKGLQLYNSYSSPSKSYIQLHRHGKPKVGVPLQFSIQSSFLLQEFHYLVIGRGIVILAGVSQSTSFTLIPTESWAPEACVLVYCVQNNGEIINDVLHIPVQQALRNKVSLNWSQDRVKPGEHVDLTVSVSEPGTLGILVVDRGTKMSVKDNDITNEMVLEELAEYNMGGSRVVPDAMTMGDPYSIFTGSHLVVLTDASLNPRENYMPEFREIDMFTESVLTSLNEETRVRKSFPETWLWLDTSLGNVTSSFNVMVPDAITSWVATAFVMSETLGLGIVSAPAELTVFQDFFISLNLPPYIVRGEVLILEVNIFNYLDVDLEVMVIVAESDTFEFVFTDIAGIPMASTRTVSVWSQNSTSVLFPIRPITPGELPISINAISTFKSDSLFQTILVKPEGIEQSYSKSLFLELVPTQTTISEKINFSFPSNVVQGSERIVVSAVGDILGPSITGLESLIQMPYGCGEQNMINFAPNIYVLRYLISTGQDDKQAREKAISYMMKGYEHELYYQRTDGSLSAFGDSDKSGSTWLSAFVLRCFLQARQFITIDQLVLDRIVMWLQTQLGPDGAFMEPGRVIHTELQGGQDSPASLTAYVLMALLEDETYRVRILFSGMQVVCLLVKIPAVHSIFFSRSQTKFRSQVSAAVSFLASRLAQGVYSDYSLCLVTYALSLANSLSAEPALEDLMARAEYQDGVPVWTLGDTGLSDSWQPSSTAIEMAAYVLLSLRRMGQLEAGIPIMKWLSQQRNHLGGYSSTQDTIIALQALSEYAVISGSSLINLKIVVHTSPFNTVATFTINKGNHLIQQSEEIQADKELKLQITAQGKGFALFQMTAFYNVESQGFSRTRRDAEEEAFDLFIAVFDMDVYHVHLLICIRLYEDMGLNQTGMAIMEVGLLSGFSLLQDTIKTDDLIRKVETAPGKVIFYLDSVSTEQVCLNIPIVMDYKVAKVQDAAVVLYDYYEPRRRTVGTYSSWQRKDVSPCWFCGNDCSACGESHSYFLIISYSPRIAVNALALTVLLIIALWL
ncbi:CD109 antigen isoform X2 [Denticeps clupeoides]|uniref:CD109 antigen isoform X2 n=1 Tax=Denticeps clupeoides TaxID=299321 RepID=UPI0010A46E26|nr:CD109 antigen isoform X2 [Denticeps clupeoides]